MCGRYVLFSALEALSDLFGFDDLPPDTLDWLRPRYNIAPTQAIAVVRAIKHPDERELRLMRWGLVPSWQKAVGGGPLNINARSESVAKKPSFRAAFLHRRCLVPADGFYEWHTEGKKKQPYFIQRVDQQPFAFAGLWEPWGDENNRIESCAIITTRANQSVTSIHPRMPVILAPGAYHLWLDPNTDPDQAQRLLRPAPSDLLVLRAVSRRVNRTGHEGEELITLGPEDDDPDPNPGGASGAGSGQLSLF